MTPYRHTVGPWWVCTNYDLIVVELEECDVILGRLQPDKLPPAWTLSGTLFLMASLLALSGAVSSLCSMCCQNCLCEHKSVFSITGIIYGFVGNKTHGIYIVKNEPKSYIYTFLTRRKCSTRNLLRYLPSSRALLPK